MEAVYTRKISAEEAREGYILILKDKLALFPPPGEPFTLVREGRAGRTSIEAIPCACRGPAKPHAHYHLPAAGLRAGERVVIVGDGAGRFTLRAGQP